VQPQLKLTVELVCHRGVLEQGEEMKIFLSYAHEHKTVAEEVHLALLGEGHDVFVDEASLPVGGSYNERIRQAIQSSDVFVFLISPESTAAGSYVLTELNLAKKKWPRPQGSLLPVLISPTDLARVDKYLTAVTVLKPVGNVAAEIAAELATWAGTTTDQPMYRALALELESMQRTLEGFVGQNLSPGTIQHACRHVSAAAERLKEFRTKLVELGDSATFPEVDLLCRAPTELENICNLDYHPEGGGGFETRVAVAQGLAKGLSIKIDELLGSLATKC